MEKKAILDTLLEINQKRARTPYPRWWFPFLATLTFLLTFPFFSMKALAEEPVADPFPLELEADLSAGTTAIYLLDFKKAETHFQHAIDLQPKHPAPYFFLMMISWYQLTYDSLLNRSPTLEKLLLERSRTAIDRSKEFSKNKEGGWGERSRSVGYLYWGGSLGAEGWYHVTRSQWFRAYFSGKSGYSLVRKAVELNPELYDAYLGIGMYEYYASTLGPTLRVLASFAIRGDKQRAIHHLGLAELKSRYVKTETSYFLWNAALEENRWEDAIEKVKVLNSSFPDSPLFKWCEIQTLYYQKKWEEVIEKGEEFIQLASEEGQREGFANHYGLLLSKVFYHSGMSAFYLKNFELAKSYFERTIDQPADFAGWRALAHLRQGELFDLKGERLNALEKYRAVLQFPPFWDSHKTARQRMKRPYQEVSVPNPFPPQNLP